MARRLRVAAFLTLATGAVHAATITTETFVLQVPDTWRVEDDKTSLVIAAGGRVVDGVALPMLMVEYCKVDASRDGADRKSCRQTCREQAQALVSRVSGPGRVSAPLPATERNGAVEFRPELVVRGPGVALAAVACKGNTQLQMALISDGDADSAKRQFDEILGSLQWK